jgi:hypothetical protein
VLKLKNFFKWCNSLEESGEHWSQTDSEPLMYLLILVKLNVAKYGAEEIHETRRQGIHRIGCQQ